MSFGPVPGPSVPLWKALLFFALILAAVFLGHGISRPQTKTQEMIRFCVVALILTVLVSALR